MNEVSNNLHSDYVKNRSHQHVDGFSMLMGINRFRYLFTLYPFTKSTFPKIASLYKEESEEASTAQLLS